MYVKYRADRPIISINDGQDWTLPEVPAADYSDEIMENAKEFSDKAAIVISRTGHFRKFLLPIIRRKYLTGQKNFQM